MRISGYTCEEGGRKGRDSVGREIERKRMGERKKAGREFGSFVQRESLRISIE